MPDVLQCLQTRNSAPRLTAPAPSREQLDELLLAALRAPDHAWLRPWRFIAIEGERREDFGEVLERCLLRRDPAADPSAREKARAAPLRAPLVLVVVARLQEHPKVPSDEQRLSAGCAAHAILLAAETLGYAGIWRTGNAALDPYVGSALGLESNEEVIAFLYLGTRDGNPKNLPALKPADFLSRW
ncbi:MAG: nitroreductase family protein [Haliea sp.]